MIIRWHPLHANYWLQEYQWMSRILVLWNLMYILMKWTVRFATGISNFEIVSSKLLIQFESNEICFIKWWNLCHKLSLKEECFLTQYIFLDRDQILNSCLMGNFWKSNLSTHIFNNFYQLSKVETAWFPKSNVTLSEGKSLIVCLAFRRLSKTWHLEYLYILSI